MAEIDTGRIYRNVEQREKRSYKRNSYLAIFCTVYAVIVAPLMEALLISLISSGHGKPVEIINFSNNESSEVIAAVQSAVGSGGGYGYLIPWGLLLIVVGSHVCAAIVTMRDNVRDSHYFDFKDISEAYELLRREYSSVRDTLEEYIAINLAITLATTGLEKVIAEANNGGFKALLEGEGPKESFEGLFYPIIWPFVQYREKIFNFKAGAIHNFALYLYDEDEKLLKVAFRKHDDRLVVRNRDWKPGYGHVGLTFLQKQLKICDDVTKSSELSVSLREADAVNYRSFASVPILWPEDEEDTERPPLGVLVVTSSHPNQFNEKTISTPLKTLSKLVAILAHEVRQSVESGGAR